MAAVVLVRRCARAEQHQQLAQNTELASEGLELTVAGYSQAKADELDDDPSDAPDSKYRKRRKSQAETDQQRRSQMQ